MSAGGLRDGDLSAADLPEVFRQFRARWQGRRQERFPATGDGIVLIGAGKVGQQFLAALQVSGIPVLAFTDNDPRRWGTTLRDTAVLAPADAVRNFGRHAVFIVTIGAIGEGVAAIRSQFSALGVETVLHFTEAIRLVPAIWREFFANPDAFVEADATRIVDAYTLFGDDESRRHFITHLEWRTTLDPRSLSVPHYHDQYFPPEVIGPRHCSVFVDIGAYIGDTLLAAAAFAGPSLRRYYAFEPDPANYAELETQAAALRDRRPDLQIVTRNTAIGADSRAIAFAGTGSATSQMDANGSVEVSCTTLDTLELPGATYVKIDVEGAEHDVFRGGTEFFRRSKPTVAVATYHRPKDLFEIPLWLAAAAPEYRFHLRSHGDAGVDLVCYAVRDGC